MEEEKYHTEEKRGRTMKIAEARGLTFEEFAKLDDEYGGFEMESTKNHPLRDEGESFMEFIKKGSEKIKFDPVIKEILE